MQKESILLNYASRCLLGLGFEFIDMGIYEKSGLAIQVGLDTTDRDIVLIQRLDIESYEPIGDPTPATSPLLIEQSVKQIVGGTADRLDTEDTDPTKALAGVFAAQLHVVDVEPADCDDGQFERALGMAIGEFIRHQGLSYDSVLKAVFDAE